jgi:uncharacterized protein involved in exopolysaccharide biosynthesis
MAIEDDTRPEGDEDDAPAGGGLNIEVLKSYLGWAKRALKKRRLLIALVLLVGVSLSAAIAKYIPRTYSCSTVLMTVSNSVLDGERAWGMQPLAGAPNLIMSHENLETLIKDSQLKKHYFARRPPILHLKDRISSAISGPMDDKVLTAVLLGTLETKLVPEVEKDQLTITVDWGDGKTAAEIAQAAQDGFLRMRHRAEISAFYEKMAILDAHATQMRQEVEDLAEQLKAAIKAKTAERAAERKAEKTDKDPEPRRVSVPAPPGNPGAPAVDSQLPELRERLAALKQKLTVAEGERSSRMQTEQSKLDELKLRLTPSHPQVITQEERVGIASQVSSELALMRSEVQDQESQIRQREAMVKTGMPSGKRMLTTEVTTSGALPTDIVSLLDERDADPALSAQMSGAIVRYGSLRDDVRGAKLALDNAQAAFNHRYQVVVPVEEPNRPSKPKVGAIFGGGLALSLLLALLLPLLLELRHDVVAEHWQVHQLQLPVLGVLHLPPSTFQTRSAADNNERS